MSKMKQVFGILLFSGLVSGYALAAQEAATDADSINARIAAVDQTCMSGDECAAAPAAPAAAGPRTGKEVFDTVCHTCHATGLMGAPKVGTAADWAPPKGTCGNCSDDEIKGAVKFMVDSSK